MEAIFGGLFGELIPVAQVGHLVEACLAYEDGTKCDRITDGLLGEAQEDAAHQQYKG